MIRSNAISLVAPQMFPHWDLPTLHMCCDPKHEQHRCLPMKIKMMKQMQWGCYPCLRFSELFNDLYDQPTCAQHCVLW